MDARSPSHPLARLGAAALVATIVLGCAGDTVVTSPAPDGSKLFWALTLDQHALNLSTVSPYDTVRVVATPRNSAGEPLTNTPAVRYSSGDLERVQVTDDGQVHAISTGTAIPIIATLSVGNITHADTALVNVIGDSVPPVLESFSIQPVPPDSAIWGANALQNFAVFDTKPIIAHDAEGNPLSGLSIYFSSSDTTIALIDRATGALSGLRPGRVTIIASTEAFGVVKADTLPFTVTMPALMLMSIAQPTPGASTVAVDPSTINIAAGGTIVWIDFTLSQLAITFDDPTNVAEDDLFCFCGAGDVPSFGADTVDINNDFRGRSFPVPGTYVFHVSGLGSATGTVIVEPPPASAQRVHATTVAGRAP